jgi:class 3 adenylate cyclase
MGSKSSKPLNEYSQDEVAACISSYGGMFAQYAQRIRENGVDGELLATMNEQELHETLDELEVESRLHRRKFLNEFKGSLPGLMDCTYSSASRGSSASDQSVSDALKARFDAQSRENSSLRSSVQSLESNRSRSAGPPMDNATIVFTDVQNSTDLWERDEHAMKQALSTHDQILRRVCGAHHGYEIDTEVSQTNGDGVRISRPLDRSTFCNTSIPNMLSPLSLFSQGDAFFLAFQETVDAYAFALNFQKALHEADWSRDILSLPWSCQDASGRRGLRVKVAVHHGPVQTRKNAVTARTEYSGPTMDIARSLENMTQGGQILTTAETWSSVFHLSETHLDSPVVTDRGSQTIGKNSKGKNDGLSKRLLDLTPASLSSTVTVNKSTALPNGNRAPLSQSLLPGVSSTIGRVAAVRI